jgi:hypothetical protein
MGPEEQWERDGHYEEITGQVEDQVRDQMMQRSRTLNIVGRCLPVIVKRSTPHSKVEYLHHNIGRCHVRRCTLDHEVLPQVLGETPVEEQQADFCSPLDGTHALFDQQNGFGPPSSHRYLVRRQFDRIRRVNKICRDSQIDVEKDNEDRVQALTRSVRWNAHGPASTYGNEHHEEVLNL